VSETTDAPAETGITEARIERLRSRIGIAVPHPMAPHYRHVNTDVFRHVAEAYGDDNPLWCNPDYGATTRWGGPIASPVLVGGDTLIGVDEVDRVGEDHRDLMKGDPLSGVHAFYASSAREWWAPLLPGADVRRRNALVGVVDKKSEFAKRAVHEWTAQVFRDADTVLSGQFRMMARTERSKARKAKKYDDIVVERYTDDEISRIDEQYARQIPRGADERWFEDVDEGDTIGPMVKGPLLVTDMVCWHVGMGMGLYGVKALDLAARNRRRIPRFFHRDELNIPDVMQRVHWDTEFAKRSGNPTTFDYGRMRETWLIHMCTNWMGDDAWLWMLDCEFRKFNYVGDTQWLDGTITRKYLAGGERPAVDIDLVVRNQRGEITTPGHATILLPSREHGPIRLPHPPGDGDLRSALDAIATDFVEGRRGDADTASINDE
jgi:acyl dehydratase